MAITPTIMSANFADADGKRFNVAFEHSEDDGYCVFILPWAQNIDPSLPAGEIVINGSDRNPGIAQHCLNPAPKFSKTTAETLKPAAIYYAGLFISRILGVYSNSEGPGAESVVNATSDSLLSNRIVASQSCYQRGRRRSRLMPGTFAFAPPQIISVCRFLVNNAHVNFLPVPYIYKSGDAGANRFSCTSPRRSYIYPETQSSCLAGNSAMRD